MAKKPELAWHFVSGSLRDGSPIPPDGEWLKHNGTVKMCECGLHASRRLIDALSYAPGSTVCRVALRKIHEKQHDKLVARERLILWRVENTDDLLHEFARKAALSVIDLWDAPDVVRQYLETGDERLRARAAMAAWGARAAWGASAARAASDAWGARAAKAARAASDARAAWDASAASAAWDARAARAAKFDELNTLLESMATKSAGNPDTKKLLEKVA